VAEEGVPSKLGTAGIRPLTLIVGEGKKVRIETNETKSAVLMMRINSPTS
jgi:hypothetical protein